MAQVTQPIKQENPRHYRLSEPLNKTHIIEMLNGMNVENLFCTITLSESETIRYGTMYVFAFVSAL